MMRTTMTLAALAVSMAVTATTAAADYTYRTIAEGSDTLFLGQCPAINNFGTVAFPASEFDPVTFNTEDKILRSAGGPLTTIAAESDGFTSIFGNPSINDFGAVAFDGNPTGPDDELIARGSRGPLTEIARADSTAGQFDSFTADVSLNNLGRVAFTGELNATRDEGLFEGSGGPVATRYLASTSQFAGSDRTAVAQRPRAGGVRRANGPGRARDLPPKRRRKLHDDRRRHRRAAELQRPRLAQQPRPGRVHRVR